MAKLLCKFKLEIHWSIWNSLECLAVLHADWAFELYNYLSFMWLSNKHLFFSSKYPLYPNRSWIKPIYKNLSFRNQHRKVKINQETCILNRNLEMDSRSMKFSILEADQWHLSRDSVTPQMPLFSQCLNWCLAYSLTSLFWLSGATQTLNQ